MKVCSSCGFQNPDSSVVCEACGSVLDSTYSSQGGQPSARLYPSGGSNTGYPSSNPGSYSSSYASGSRSKSKASRNKAKKKKSPSNGVSSSYSGQSSYASGSSYPSGSYGSSSSSYSSGRPPKKNGSKSMIVAGIVAVIALGGAGGWWFYSHNAQSPEQSASETSGMHLSDLSLQTGSTAPEQDGLAGEYAAAVAANDLAKAEEIELRAQEELTGQELKDTKQQFALTDQAHSILTADGHKKHFTVIADLGNVEGLPVSLQNEVWAIKKDGKFSFIDTAGKKVSDSEANKLQIHNAAMGSQSANLLACLADDDNGLVFPSPNDQYPPNKPGESYCRGGGAAGSFIYQLNDDLQVEIIDFGSKLPVDEKEVNPELLPVIVYRIAEPEKLYIYNPQTKELDGPYEAARPGAFNMYHHRSVDDLPNSVFTGMYIANPVDIKTGTLSVGSPYWVSRDGTLTLYDAKGQKSLSGVEEATVIDPVSISAIKDGKFCVYDDALNESYSGPFEAGGARIGSVMPVQQSGKWILISIDE